MRVLGDHNYRRDYFAAAGTPLAALPFCGAVYRVGHAKFWSHSRGIWRRYFLTKAMLKNPLALTRRVLRLRRKTAARSRPPISAARLARATRGIVSGLFRLAP